MSRRRAYALVVVLALMVGGCAGTDPSVVAVPPTTVDTAAEPITPSTTATATSEAPPPSTSTPPAPTSTVPPLADDGVARAVETPTGVVLPVLAEVEGGYRVRTPCAVEAVVAGLPLSAAHVVIDPGHGGEEPGAVGPSGLREADVNLDVSERLAAVLESQGYTVVLTRTDDYRITLATRAEIATMLDAAVFVSIHHNASPDGPWEGPGSETYYQVASPDSKRLAGLVWEEAVEAFGVYDIDWVADLDAGAKYRPGSDGTDYYGILRRSAGVPAVLTELAFISNPSEEALLADGAFRQVEAEAVARAIGRFLTTDDPGSGFVEPYPRTTPAGPGGGSSGCEDPLLA